MAETKTFRRKADGMEFGPLTEAQATKGLHGYPHDFEEVKPGKPLEPKFDDEPAKVARKQRRKPAPDDTPPTSQASGETVNPDKG